MIDPKTKHEAFLNLMQQAEDMRRSVTDFAVIDPGNELSFLQALVMLTQYVHDRQAAGDYRKIELCLAVVPREFDKPRKINPADYERKQD